MTKKVLPYDPRNLPFPSGGDEDAHVASIQPHEVDFRRPSTSAAERDERRQSRWRGQVARVNEKAQRPDYEAGRCFILGCGKPSRAATSNGFDRRYCRAHAEHIARHGDATRGTFTAAELQPFRLAALKWLTAHAGDRFIKATLQRIEGRMQSAGRVLEANNLRGTPPEGKARAVWSRLRDRGVTPERIAEAWLTVWLATIHARAEGRAPHDHRFRRVQTAKAIHRLAAGFHRRWEQSYGDKTWTTELHVYPASRGRVLVHLGKQLDAACEWLSGHDAEAVMREVGVSATAKRQTTGKPRGRKKGPQSIRTPSGPKLGVAEVEMPGGVKLTIRTN